LKKNNLIILAHSKYSNFGLGDYLRILTFVPNLKFKNYFWISDKKLFPIANNCDFIVSKYKIGTKIAKKKIAKSDLVIDLYNKKTKFKNSVLINSILKKTKNIKINTLDICEILSKYFEIKNYKLFTNKKKKNKKNFIFFNWIVPLDWRMKEYPLSKWKLLEKTISDHYPNSKIIWQKTSDNLSQLFKRIENSKIIISTVGLGSHIAMLFNKKTILLCGPTYFNEVKDFKNTKIIKSLNLCKIHKKKLNLKLNKCKCMSGIDNKKIFFTLKKML